MMFKFSAIGETEPLSLDQIQEAVAKAYQEATKDGAEIKCIQCTCSLVNIGRNNKAETTQTDMSFRFNRRNNAYIVPDELMSKIVDFLKHKNYAWKGSARSLAIALGEPSESPKVRELILKIKKSKEAIETKCGVDIKFSLSSDGARIVEFARNASDYVRTYTRKRKEASA